MKVHTYVGALKVGSSVPLEPPQDSRAVRVEVTPPEGKAVEGQVLGRVDVDDEGKPLAPRPIGGTGRVICRVITSKVITR